MKKQNRKSSKNKGLRFSGYPETRTSKPRGQNTINDVFTKLRTLFRWAVD